MSTQAAQIGVDYFPEHWPEERWSTDAKLMVEAGLSVARIAEFTWSKIQPQKDLWEWEWLDRAINVLAEAGLKVIVCTHSACPPPWMIQADPSICPVLSDGNTLGLGERRHYSPNHMGYRDASVDMARRMAERYGQHPAVIGFQIDNELCGALPDHGPLATAAFHQWLQQRHGTLKQLDENLGLIFWGAQYDDWSQIPVPASGSWHPGLRLEFQRFTSWSWVEFCRVQAEAMRPLIGDRVLTTNCYLHRWGMAVDWHDLVQRSGLDRFAFDNYSNERHENAFYNDLGRSLTTSYWILEQQCGTTGGQHLWPDQPGRIHDFINESVQHGAEVITYFRWRQCLFGREQDHGAILDHSGTAGAIWQEVKESCAAIAAAGPVETPNPRIGIAFTWDDAWALESSPESLNYTEIVRTHVYQACYLLHEKVQFCFTPDDISDLDIIIVPLKVIADKAWEAAIAAAVQAGKTVVVLPLAQAKDEWSKYQVDYQSETMRQLQGVHIERRVPLRGDFELNGSYGGTAVTAQYRCEAFVVDEGTTVLAQFTDEPLQNGALVTAKQHGAGRVISIAGYLKAEGLSAVLKDLL